MRLRAVCHVQSQHSPIFQHKHVAMSFDGWDAVDVRRSQQLVNIVLIALDAADTAIVFNADQHHAAIGVRQSHQILDPAAARYTEVERLRS